MIQFLDLKVDVVFKDFFGDMSNKEVLESFLNAVLDLSGDDVVEVEHFLDPRKMRIEVGKPTTFVDISVKTKGGERYIIEMQTYNHEGFDKRLLYYLGKDYTEQLDYLKEAEEQVKRKKVGWRDLPRVHIIAIIDFHRSALNKDGILNGPNVVESYAFRPFFDQDNDHLFDQWRATLVDLKKFKDKPFDELEKYREWWFFLLKNASSIKEKELEKLKKDPVFRMALERLERLSSDPETRKAYEESINEQRNVTAILDASLKEGLEKGRAEGLEKGLEKGRKEEKFAIASSLLSKGMSSQEVAEVTGLGLDQVKALDRKSGCSLKN